MTIPGGNYEVECNEDRKNCKSIEIDSFEIQQFEVPLSEWKLCVENRRCFLDNIVENSEIELPLLGVFSNEKITRFLEWKNEQDNWSYRLPYVEEYITVINQLTKPVISACKEIVGDEICGRQGPQPSEIRNHNKNDIQDIWGNVAEVAMYNHLDSKKECQDGLYLIGGHFGSTHNETMSTITCLPTGRVVTQTGLRLVRFK